MSSNAKEFIFEEEARRLLQDGIKQLADVVGVTLGPKGRHIGLDASWGAPTITNDGNRIAKDVELKDQYHNMGAAIGKEVAAKMKEKCGDGTTSSILLLSALVNHGVKSIASGASPTLIKRGMEKTLAVILKELEKKAIPIKSNKELQDIATASASGNSQVGKIIAEAFEKVGKEGVITIEEGKTTETQVEMVEGMQFDRGYASSYFCTNTDHMTAEMSAPSILITDKKISSAQEILTILQAIAGTGKELLIIAEDIEGDALSTLVINRLRGTLKVCAVKAPGFGESRKAMLQDIATLTGATLISEETGTNLRETELSMLGSSEKVVVTKDATTIIGGIGKKEAIQERIKQIDGEIAAASSSYDKDKLNERKARLVGGVALIRVGGATEPEMKQQKQLFEDSLSSTRAASEEGILPGGGASLLRAAKAAEKKIKLSGDEAIGANAVIMACSAPMRRLALNSGLDPSIILEEVIEAKENYGFNAFSERVEDLAKAGVIDSFKVIKSALNLSISAAGVVLLSEVLIGNAPEEDSGE